MESDRFDAFTRTLRSRRTALTGVLGAVAAWLGLAEMQDASAHNPIPACRRIADPVKRRRCLRRAKAHNRNKHSCKPRPFAVTCANRCGRTQNNCKNGVTCICQPGKPCLSNRTCSRVCGPSPSFDCPAGCSCSALLADTPTVSHCIPATITCLQVPQKCTSTAQCPFGQFCGLVCEAPPLGRCIPVCPH